jgi:uncharacterized protein
MTTSAIEVVRNIYERLAEGDHDGVRARMHDDVRWRQAPAGVPAAGVEATGLDLFFELVIAPLEVEWDGFIEDVDELTDHGDSVVATGTYRGTYRATGRSLTAEFCHLWTVGDGRVTAFRQFTDTAAFVVATAPVGEAA